MDLLVCFQSVFHNWGNKGHGTYDLVNEMVRIKYPLLLIIVHEVVAVGLFSFFELSLTICLMLYNHK